MPADSYLALRRKGADEAETYGPAAVPELRALAEKKRGGALPWYEAFGGNFYADAKGIRYAIRAIISQTWPPRN